MALQTGTRLGPYEIQSAIGAGGMGDVYKATDTGLDRTVAIKVLPNTSPPIIEGGSHDIFATHYQEVGAAIEALLLHPKSQRHLRIGWWVTNWLVGGQNLRAPIPGPSKHLAIGR